MTLEIHFLLVPRGLAFKDALGAGRCITGGFSGSLILFHLSPWTLLVHSTFGLKTDPKKVWAKIDMTIWMDFLTSSSWRLLYSLSRKKWVKLKTESMLRIWVFPKIMVPPNHPMFNGVWNHYFHHPFWGTHPYFLETSIFRNMEMVHVSSKPRCRLCAWMALQLHGFPHLAPQIFFHVDTRKKCHI